MIYSERWDYITLLAYIDTQVVAYIGGLYRYASGGLYRYACDTDTDVYFILIANASSSVAYNVHSTYGIYIIFNLIVGMQL